MTSLNQFRNFFKLPDKWKPIGQIDRDQARLAQFKSSTLRYAFDSKGGKRFVQLYSTQRNHR